MKDSSSPPLVLVNERPRTRVVRELKNWIEKGILPVGELLPSEQLLAEQLQANRGTVRNALRLLSEEGFIEGNGHRRVVVSSTPERPVVNEPSHAPLLRNTAIMATVSSENEKKDRGHHSSGWSHFIDRGIIEACSRAQMHCLTLHTPTLQQDEWTHIIAAQPRCAFITDSLGNVGPIRMALELKQAGVPIVVYGDDPAFAGFDRVVSDQESGAFQLTQWLIERGHQRILQIGPFDTPSYWFLARRAGYECAMRNAGHVVLPCADGGQVPHSLPVEVRLKLGVAMAREVLEAQAEQPDAIMVPSDGDVAVWGLACEQMGLVPNQDVALVGYDNYWSDALEKDSVSFCPLATVDKNNENIGREMVALLLARLQGDLPTTIQRRLVPPQLLLSPSESQ